MKLPDQQEVGRAVQILCAAINVDARSEGVTEVSINSRKEVTVTRIIPGTDGRAMIDRQKDNVYTVSTTGRTEFTLPETNPYMPGGNA